MVSMEQWDNRSRDIGRKVCEQYGVNPADVLEDGIEVVNGRYVVFTKIRRNEDGSPSFLWDQAAQERVLDTYKEQYPYPLT